MEGQSHAGPSARHGRKGKEVYTNKELIKDKINNDLYYQKRKVELYLNKTTRDKKNINLYYQKEEFEKKEEVSVRKEGSDDKKELKNKDKEELREEKGRRKGKCPGPEQSEERKERRYEEGRNKV